MKKIIVLLVSFVLLSIPTYAWANNYIPHYPVILGITQRNTQIQKNSNVNVNNNSNDNSNHIEITNNNEVNNSVTQSTATNQQATTQTTQLVELVQGPPPTILPSTGTDFPLLSLGIFIPLGIVLRKMAI